MDEKPSVFLSYTHKDRRGVLPLAKYLARLGLEVWMDTKDLVAGQPMIHAISEAIAKADLYVLCLSPAALESQWVAHELETALTLETTKGRPKVLAVLVEKTALPPTLVSRLCVDISESVQRGKAQLRQAVEHHLGASVGRAVPEETKETSQRDKGQSQIGAVQRRLERANLRSADLHGAGLRGTDLRGMDLAWADLSEADLREADLSGADLWEASLTEADLSGADLRGANLGFANLLRAVLKDAHLASALLCQTLFGDTDLSGVQGLDSVRHAAPSILDERTLRNSWPLPERFLRGCGVSDDLIAFYRATLGKAIEFYSCFISYSSRDQAFAERLHADLQDKGMRCWFAPEDMKIGHPIQVRIDESVRLYDKLLVILSEHSVGSAWVETEVETALEKERRRKRDVLFPVRIDDAVMRTRQAWAAEIRRTRHIGDFRRWKEHEEYQKAFERLLRDLKAEGEKAGRAT